jgi:uncharacterized glyoxalase superfamily protein PhnB
MLQNRSLPPGAIFPELPYSDVGGAADWLCRVFGFKERLRMGNHRRQLVLGEAAMIVVEVSAGRSPVTEQAGYGVMVRVEDVDEHYGRSRRNGARIMTTPETYPFGERQYTAEDFAGHRWTFTQTVTDVDPVEWGGHLAAGNGGPG